MSEPLYMHLSRRESQIMGVVYRLGEATVADVVEEMPEDLSYDTVRVTLGILEKKGYLRHWKDGQKYVFQPVISPDKAKQSALRHIMETFFQGSFSKAMLAMADISDKKLTQKDLDELSNWIEEARKEAQ